MEITCELYHHGIKGQKWGIRRFQPYPKGERVEGGKEIGEATKVKQRGSLSSQDQFKWKNYVNNDIVLKKGDYLYRADAHSTINPERKALYTSLKENHLGYLSSAMDQNGMAMDLTIDNGNNGNPYSLKLKLQKDLIIPSYKKSVNTFLDTIKDLPADKGQITISEKYNEVQQDSNYFLSEYEKIQNKGKIATMMELKKLKKYHVDSVDQVKIRAYQGFMESLFMDSDRRKLFFDNLEKQGYNAVVDDQDYNTDEKVSTPLIIFKKDSIKQVGSKPVLKKDENYIYDYWKTGENKRWTPETEKEWNDWLEDRPKKKR